MMFHGTPQNLLRDESGAILVTIGRERSFRKLRKKTEDAKLAISSVFNSFLAHRLQVLQFRSILLSPASACAPILNGDGRAFLEFLAFINGLNIDYRPGASNLKHTLCFLYFTFFSLGLSTIPGDVFDGSFISFDMSKRLCEFVCHSLLNSAGSQTLNPQTNTIILRVVEMALLVIFPDDQRCVLALLNVSAKFCTLDKLLVSNSTLVDHIYACLVKIELPPDLLSDVCLKLVQFLGRDPLVFKSLVVDLFVALNKRKSFLLSNDHFLEIFTRIRDSDIIQDFNEADEDSALYNSPVHVDFARWFFASFFAAASMGNLTSHRCDLLYGYSIRIILSLFELLRQKGGPSSWLSELSCVLKPFPPYISYGSIALMVHFDALFSYFDFEFMYPPQYGTLDFADAFFHIKDMPFSSLISLIYYQMHGILQRRSGHTESLSFSFSALNLLFIRIIPSKISPLIGRNSVFYTFLLYKISTFIRRLLASSHIEISYGTSTNLPGACFITIPKTKQRFDLSPLSKFIAENCQIFTSIFKACSTGTCAPSLVFLEDDAEYISKLSTVLLPYFVRVSEIRPEKLIIRNGFALQDGLRHFVLSREGYFSSSPWFIIFTDENGTPEPGADGGGLYRQFLSESLSSVLDPKMKFFEEIHSKENYLSSALIFPSFEEPCSDFLLSLFNDPFLCDVDTIYRYMGHLLGRIVLARLPLSGLHINMRFPLSFWCQLLSLPSLPECKINEMREIDSFYLLQLLSLDHTLKSKSISPDELAIFNDEGLLVDENNFPCYLFSSIQKKVSRPQIAKIALGFFSLVPPEIFSIFNATEISCIIDGRYTLDPENGRISMDPSADRFCIDLNDWRENTVYVLPYTSQHPTIVLFWNLLSKWEGKDLSSLLRFCTGYGSGPYLGFKEFNPLFCIGYGGASPERLPTASTCVHMLTLPEYASEDVIEIRLRTAIGCQRFLLS
ncbi:hypothetical protein MDAP_000347 [Mitosporidium daphniae]